AAMIAPSTIGELQRTTCRRRSSGNSSIAISLLVSAPPRSTRMATPRGDPACSIARSTFWTSLPSPPSGLTPAAATVARSARRCPPRPRGQTGPAGPRRFEHRREDIEHRLLARCRLAASAHGFDAGGEHVRQDRHRRGSLAERLAHGDEEAAIERAGGAAD